MRLVLGALILSVGIGLLGATAAKADSPYPIRHCYHDPMDLKAYNPPGPGPGTDGTGTVLVEPPRKLDPALLNDPNQVKWPTLDKSEWERLKGSYKVLPCPKEG
jgi:hypothetical protein